MQRFPHIQTQVQQAHHRPGWGAAAARSAVRACLPSFFFSSLISRFANGILCVHATMQAHVARIMTRPLLSLIYPINSITGISSRHFTVSYYMAELCFLFFLSTPSLCSTILHTLCACASYSNYDPSFIHPTAIRFRSYTTGASLCLNSTCCHDNLCFPLLFLTPCIEALAYSRAIYPQP